MNRALKPKKRSLTLKITQTEYLGVRKEDAGPDDIRKEKAVLVSSINRLAMKRYKSMRKQTALMYLVDVMAYIPAVIYFLKHHGAMNDDVAATTIGLAACVMLFGRLYRIALTTRNLKLMKTGRKRTLLLTATCFVLAEIIAVPAMLYALLSFAIITLERIPLGHVCEERAMYLNYRDIVHWLEGHELTAKGVKKLFARNRSYGVAFSVSFAKDARESRMRIVDAA